MRDYPAYAVRPADLEDPFGAERAEQLVDALMKVPVLDSLRSRRLCVDSALDRLRQRLSVAEFDDKKPHLVEMVRTFGTVPDGWRELAATVRFLADYDLPSEQAAALAHGPVQPATDPGRRGELAALLGGLDRRTVPDLAAIFAFVAGEEFGALPAAVRTAWEAYELLEQCNVPVDGVPRTVRFVEEVACAVGPGLGDPLRRWLSHHVRTVTPRGVDAMRTLGEARRATGTWRRKTEGAAYVVVRVQPCSDQRRDVWLTCWTSAGDTWEPRQRDDRRMPFADVPAHVARLVDQEEARLRTHQGGVVLEFILPVDMVNEPVEDWPRSSPFGEVAGDASFTPSLGADYNVVIRSLERMEALQLHRVWNERWNVLTRGTQGRVHRCKQGDGAQQQLLYAQLKQNPDIVVMALGSSPQDAAGRSELMLGLQAGLPVLLWAHQGHLGARETAAAERVAETGAWEALLDHVTRLRFAPDPRDDGQGCIRSRIAVLWDDPNRLPEAPDPAL
ncbi:effector-associated domain 2-containing protein [Streptomyces sp. HMX87]|uniref:VMAP-C domain-containing protein n=1 Tax=Streptomyces sp. HMX87 TaxID=3390849 RepID=UPI003A84CBAA